MDGTDLKQLTTGAWHDYNACWLPDGDIAFLTTRAAQFAYCWDAPVGVLHRMKPNGSRLLRLSANYLNDFTPQVLEDGRIMEIGTHRDLINSGGYYAELERVQREGAEEEDFSHARSNT